MKLKYYLRGLGMGIIVTALILLIFYSIKGRMSDKDVIARAEKLGMVMKETDDDTLFHTQSASSETEKDDTEATTEQEEESTEEITEAESEEATEATTEETTEAQTETAAEVTTEAPTQAPTEEPTQAPTEAPAEGTVSGPEQNTYVLTISRGMYSEAVSLRLAEAGMVASAAEFNSYLENNGYAERLKTGVYNITAGMSYEEIAGMIVQ